MADIKPFRTFKEQIELLKDRGLIIEDEEKALNTLRYCNYYRISGYTLTLRNHDVFYNGVTFDNVLEIYNFDSELRALILYVLSNIEVSFRTHLAYYNAKKYGPLGYLNYDGFVNPDMHNDFMAEFNKIISNDKRNNESFTKHYRDNYNNKFPIWVTVELLSFGNVSKLYSNLEHDIKQEIAIDNYGINYEYIQNWLRGLTILRNICAHRGRLYNRPMPIKPKLSNKDKKLGIRNDLVFIYIFILKKLVKDDNVWNNFLNGLESIVKNYPFVKLSNLGFPINWYELLQRNIS